MQKRYSSTISFSRFILILTILLFSGQNKFAGSGILISMCQDGVPLLVDEDEVDLGSSLEFIPHLKGFLMM
jgi:hypothetical protein